MALSENPEGHLTSTPDRGPDSLALGGDEPAIRDQAVYLQYHQYACGRADHCDPYTNPRVANH